MLNRTLSFKNNLWYIIIVKAKVGSRSVMCKGANVGVYALLKKL